MTHLSLDPAAPGITRSARRLPDNDPTTPTRMMAAPGGWAP